MKTLVTGFATFAVIMGASHLCVSAVAQAPAPAGGKVETREAAKPAAATTAEAIGTYALPSGDRFLLLRDDKEKGVRMSAVGQEAVARLYYGQKFQPRWLDLFATVNRRANQVMRDSLKSGTRDKFAEAFEPEVAASVVDAAFKAWTESAARGPAGVYEVIGSQTGKEMITYFSIQSGKEVVTWKATWGSTQRLTALERNAERHPFTVTLTAKDNGTYTAKSLFGDAPIEINVADKKLLWMHGDGKSTEFTREESPRNIYVN